MVKSTKILLQKPWRFSEDSPYYTSLCEYSPKGIEYINPSKNTFAQNKEKLRFLNWLKGFVRKSIRKFYPSMPNVRYTKNDEKYDLIHCTRCMSSNKHPWICDIEFVGNFWTGGYSSNYPSKKKVLKYLMSPYCKKIMAWTEWCANDIKRILPEIAHKVEVVYPAIPEKKFKKIKTGKTVLLFVSRKFYFKGGLYAIEVMDRITKENENVEGWVVSDVPDEILEKYSGNKQIKFLGMKTHKELNKKIYPAADIFLYPSFTDTFGFAILEAMSFGLPVVTCSGQSRKELIEEGKNGFVVDLDKKQERNDIYDLSRQKRTVENILKRTIFLMNNRKLTKKISGNNIMKIKKGNFSIKKRNKEIHSILNEVEGVKN